MKRRGFFAFLGLAPAAVVAPKLLSASTLGTHPVVNAPNLQCGRCGGSMAFEPFTDRAEFLRTFHAREPVLAKCWPCGVIVSVPIPYIDCRVVARDGE